MQPETEDLGLGLPLVGTVEGRAESGLKAEKTSSGTGLQQQSAHPY